MLERPAVLVVDDEPRILTSMTSLLEDDFEVLTSSDAQNALGILEQERFAVIIADQRMPGLNGDEFLAKAKTLSEATRILITGYADISALMRAVNHGQIYTYLSKPWEPLELRVAVTKAAEHCRLKEEVERERNLMHALMNNIPDAIWFKDKAGRFTQVNKAAAVFLGASDPAEAVGKTVFDFIPADQATEIRDIEEEIIRAGRVETNRLHQLQFRGAGIRWVSTTRAPVLERDGEVAALVGVSRDVTDERRAELALQRSEQKYRQIVETAAEGVWVVDDHLRTVFVNHKMAAMLGSQPDEMQGRLVSDFMPSEELSIQLERFEQTSSTAGTADLRLQKSDGTLVWALISSSPMTDESGLRTGTLAMLSDVTERKILEEQFRQAQKLEAVGRFASGVAHDFNNILTVVSGHSQLLLRRLEAGSPLRAPVEKIGVAAGQAANMTRQLLCFSRKRSTQFQVLELNDIISSFAKLCHPILGEAIELIMKLDSRPGRVRGDAGQLDQVLMNLVVNARHAMPQGGRLTIETADIERAAPASLQNAKSDGAYVRLSVTDTGCGMDAATRARIFEPFFTTKEEGQGTGLGLSTVHGIVAQHGGWIEVISEPGHGAEFSVYLPRVIEAVESAPPPEPTAEWPRGNETILVVDDRTAVRELVRETLQQCGYRVFEATDGQNALEFLHSYTKQIDMILSDLNMPRMSGAELGRLVLKRRPNMKLLFMSGYSEESALAETLGPLLSKPFTPQALAAKVRETLGAGGRARSVLVVDDEPEILNLLCSILASEGYEVHSAENGLDAMALLKQAQVDLVLTDLAMPEQDGIETLRLIRKEHPEMKVIAMSGTFAGPVLATARYLGANAVLSKPIEVEDLLKTLQEVF